MEKYTTEEAPFTIIVIKHIVWFVWIGLPMIGWPNRMMLPKIYENFSRHGPQSSSCVRLFVL
jgi:hypothetical protein